jgi:hypothetical protein
MDHEQLKRDYDARFSLGLSVSREKILGVMGWVVAQKQPGERPKFLIDPITRTWGTLLDCKSFVTKEKAEEYMRPLWDGFGINWHYIVASPHRGYCGFYNIQLRDYYLTESWYLQDAKRIDYLDNLFDGNLNRDEEYIIHTKWSSDYEDAYQFANPVEAQKLMLEILKGNK